MKKTDLVKHLAKKLDGRMKSTGVPDRFGQGSAASGASTAKHASRTEPAVPKRVAVSCRLPSELVNRLRRQAVDYPGGINAVMTRALERWLSDEDVEAPTA